VLPDWFGAYGSEKYFPQLMIRALPPGIIALVAASLLTPPQPRKQVDDFFLLLRTPVGQEQKLVDAGVRVVYMGSTAPNRWETNHPRLVHWGGFAVAAGICVLVLGLLYLLATIGS
jgi:hypothetical protein